jgi:hypothetical protein
MVVSNMVAVNNRAASRKLDGPEMKNVAKTGDRSGDARGC